MQSACDAARKSCPLLLSPAVRDGHFYVTGQVRCAEPLSDRRPGILQKSAVSGVRGSPSPDSGMHKRRFGSCPRWLAEQSPLAESDSRCNSLACRFDGKGRFGGRFLDVEMSIVHRSASAEFGGKALFVMIRPWVLVRARGIFAWAGGVWPEGRGEGG